MIRRLALLLVVLGTLAAAAEFLLPAALSELVARGMARTLGTDKVAVTLENRPAIFMLGGDFTRVTAAARDAKVDRLVLSDARVTMTGVKLDMEQLVASRTIALERVKTVDLAVTLSQEEIARYIASSVKGISNVAVTVTPSRVRASGMLTIGGIAKVAVTLEGRIVADQAALKFVADRLVLNNAFARNIAGSVFSEVTLLEFAKLPFGVRGRDVAMEEGQVVITADNR